MPTVLDVGSGPSSRRLPPHYSDWTRVRLDIDPKCKPDILLDARKLMELTPGMYDAVYCAHNLEHYHRHEAAKVAAGMRHVVKYEGFVEIRVPDIEAVVHAMTQQKLDIDDVLYEAPRGPILVRDVIYGYHVEIEQSGQDFYAHRTGFTRKALQRFLQPIGFRKVVVGSFEAFELTAYAFPSGLKPKQAKLLRLPENLCD